MMGHVNSDVEDQRLDHQLRQERRMQAGSGNARDEYDPRDRQRVDPRGRGERQPRNIATRPSTRSGRGGGGGGGGGGRQGGGRPSLHPNMEGKQSRGSIRQQRGGGAGGRGEGRNKRVRREVNRALHRNWEFANRFLFVLVVLYAIPTLLELYYASIFFAGDKPCESGLQYWMYADAFITIAFALNHGHSVWRMHFGLEADPELKDYLLNHNRVGEEETQRFELKYTLLHKKSTFLPRSLSSCPMVVSILGFILWLDARDEGECTQTLITATGVLSVIKVVAPVVIGTVYGFSLLFLMTGVRRERNENQQGGPASTSRQQGDEGPDSDEEVEMTV